VKSEVDHFPLGGHLRRRPVRARAPGTGSYPALMSPPAKLVSSRERQGMATVLLVAAGLIVAYWVAWFTRRSLVASESSVPYMQFEDAFPLADGWLALCLTTSALCLVGRRRAALFWLLAGGGAGLYLFGMDVLYDLEHGVWGKGTNGIIELLINLLTLGLSLFVLRWTWAHHAALLEP
jgi:hypothetical protein